MDEVTNEVVNNIVDGSITSTVNEIELLQQIHTDLGVITSFIALFIVFALLLFVYKAISNFFSV